VNDANDLLAQLYVLSGRLPIRVSVVRGGTLIQRQSTVGCGL
jgi:hypothetical protein